MSKLLRSDDITEECWDRRHDSCSGYTEPEWDAECCNCRCHDDAAELFVATS